jgi:hypothetical protein
VYLPISIHRISPKFARAKGTHQITLEIPKTDSLLSSVDSNHLILHTPYTFEYKPTDTLSCVEKILDQNFDCFFALDYQEIESMLGSSSAVSTETKFGKAIVIKNFGNVIAAHTVPTSSDVMIINFEIGLIPAPESEALINDYKLSIYNR